MLDLNQEDKGRLRNLNNDVKMIESLKKLFLNAFIKVSDPSSVEVLAAERKAIEYLQDAFKELARIRPDETEPNRKENIV